MLSCKKLFVCTMLLCLYLPVVALAQAVQTFDHSHVLWDKLLQQYVVDAGSSSTVKYAQWKQDTAALNKYLQQLSAVSKEELSAWNSQQRLAFLINAYNAFTVKLVLDHYPVKSIKDIGSFFRSSWKIKFFQLLQQDRHLDDIEHTLIRGDANFSEPRIHFALVCASIGCPKLHNRAFTTERLESMLESGAKAFLQDASRNRYNANQNELQLSSIFKWYGEDFIKTHGSVEKFVAAYVSQDPNISSQIQSGQISIEFLDYDWALNESR